MAGTMATRFTLINQFQKEVHKHEIVCEETDADKKEN